MECVRPASHEVNISAQHLDANFVPWIYNLFITDIYNFISLSHYRSNAVVPLPDFFESADFFEPISRKSGSVNTKIGKSVTPNFGTIKIGRV